MSEINLNKQEELILEEATEWFLRLQENKVSKNTLDEWENWYKSDPEHKKAFESVESLWKDLDNVSSPYLNKNKSLQEDTYDTSISVEQFLHDKKSTITNLNQNNTPEKFSFLQKKQSVYALAASLLILFTLSFFYFNTSINSQSESSTKLLSDYKKDNTFETIIAEHKTINLDDGSTIEMGAKSLIVVEFSQQIRKVRLIQGEAFFQVAKDHSRPFVVDTGYGFVQAIGTAFNIRHMQSEVDVTVIEGVVQINEKELTSENNHSNQKKPKIALVQIKKDKQLVAGDQASLKQNRTISPIKKVDSQNIISWRSGLMTFIDAPLDDVIESINRYSSQKIVIADSRAKQLTFTGTVFKSDIQPWLLALQKGYPVRAVSVSKNKVLILTKA